MHHVFCWLDTPYPLSEYVCQDYLPHDKPTLHEIANPWMILASKILDAWARI